MAKTKVGKINFRSVNGVDLAQPIQLDVYFEGHFFIYTPEYLIAMIKPEDRTIRHEGTKSDKKQVHIMIGDSPGKVETKLWNYLDVYFRDSYVEEKIIHYNFRFNSNKHANYVNNRNKSISFADTPAMSLKWGIHYLVTFPDGRKTVLSSPYKDYGALCSNKFDRPLDQYSENQQWIHWSEERQQFFMNTEASMENLIDKVNKFFSQEPMLLATAVDNMPKLIG